MESRLKGVNIIEYIGIKTRKKFLTRHEYHDNKEGEE